MSTRKLGLVDLPEVVLSQILAQESASYAVVNLWKCGDSRLNRRIANGGCETVILTDQDWTSTSRWPMLLRSLKSLRVLKIIRDGYIMPIDKLSLELRKLSPTLETLEIECYGAESSLLNYNELTSISSSRFNTTRTPRGESRLWNIGHIYPRLKRLRVWEPNRMGSYTFQLADLIVLPPSLAYISMNVCFERGDLSVFPRQMESITVGILSAPFEGDVSLLPPNLTFLDGFTCEEDDVDTLAKYPRTLTNCDAFFGFALFEPEMASALPPALKTLDSCDSFDTLSFEEVGISPWTLALPQNLTKLQLSSLPGEVVLTWSEISALPRTLVELTNAQIDWTSLESTVTDGRIDLSCWPPSLTTLQFLESQVSITSSESMRCLPLHLERLLSLEVETGFQFTRPFPPLLRELELIGTDIILYHTLPDTLESIRCTGDVDFRHIQPLPATLCKADMMLCPGCGPQRQRFNFGMLPPELRHLTVTCCSTECLGELPRSITWLTILDLVGQPSPDTFDQLPPNLEYLCIGQMRYDRSTCCTNLAFAALPKSLQSLRITNAVLPGSTLRFIPRNIRDLGLKFASLSAEDLKGMPTSQLRTFTPYEITEISEIESEVAHYWPELPLNESGLNSVKSIAVLDDIRSKHSLLRTRNQLYPDPRVLIES